jgi:hypothetical protein
MKYAKLQSAFDSRSDAMMSPASVIEARPEVPEEASRKKRELDKLNASLKHAIRVESMKAYAKFQDEDRCAEDKQQIEISRIEMLSACVRQRIYDENIKGYAELKDTYPRAEKERKLDMLSASVRNRIHNENIMTYANLRNVDGREAAIVPETSATYLDNEIFSAKQKDVNVDRQVSGASTSVPEDAGIEL